MEVLWNYAPNSNNSKWDLMNMNEDYAKLFLKTTSTSIGSTYKKALYREFNYDKHKGCDWESQKQSSDISTGILGPTIRAVVGDTIVVYFYNMANEFSYSMHPHGLSYTDVSINIFTYTSRLM
jgi:hypothetical protein